MVLTMALKKCEIPWLNLFSNDLKRGEYRLFTNGSVVISIWASDKIVKTASTAHTIIENMTKIRINQKINQNTA